MNLLIQKLRSSSRSVDWRLVVILLGCLFRVCYAFYHPPTTTLYSDMARHWDFAAHPATENPKAFEDSIGYQLWLGIIVRLAAGTPQLMGLYAAMLSVGTVLIWSRVFCEMAGKSRLTLVATMLLAWFPPWIPLFGYCLMESMVPPLLGLSLWMTFRAARLGQGSGLNAAAAAWLLLGLCRPQLSTLAPVGMIWAWWLAGRPWIQGLRTAGWVFAIVLFLGWRSWLVTGIFAPLGIGAQNAAYFWCGSKEMIVHYKGADHRWYSMNWAAPSLYQEPFAPWFTYKSFRSSEPFEVHLDLDHLRESWRMAIQDAKKRGQGWLPQASENMLHLFFGETWAANRDDRPLERAAQHFRWIWLPLFIGVLIRLSQLILLRRDRDAALLFPLLLVWFATHGLLPIGVLDGRFRIAGEGLILASLVLVLSWKKQSTAVQIG